MWSPSDEGLLTGLASGDPVASAAFIRRFQHRVFGLAYTITGDRGVAEEIAQEAFLRAWRHGDSYDPRRGQVATWLLSITRNLAIDRARLRRTEPVAPELLATMQLAAWERAGRGEAPVDDIVDIRDAIAALPEDQRRALLMAALHGLTAREIAAVEGMALGTAKTRIRTALRKLRAGLVSGDEQRRL
jgi:RNA polymerase sigma factor (sigma-70 family)